MLEGGNVFERAGVGFSHVLGNKLPPAATIAHPEAAGRAWEAMGVSLVLHPRNPYVPTVHMNIRFFVAKAPINNPEAVDAISSQDLPAKQGGKNKSAQTAHVVDNIAQKKQKSRQAVEDAANAVVAAKADEDIWWFGGGMEDRKSVV